MSDPDRLGSNTDATDIQSVHRDLETLTLFSQTLGGRYPHVLKGQFRGTRGVDPELVFMVS